MNKENRPDLSLGSALIPIVFLTAALSVVIIMLRQPPHIALIGASAVASFVALKHGQSYKQLQEGMIQGIRIGLGALLILMVVGTMIGTWILGGIVPAMVYYGLSVFSPALFLATTLVICSIVALGTGSSWSTVGTIGVALIGVGQGLGIPVPMVAGAIVSGAYFGDKMSPLSDTTNLAPAVAGTDIFSHIRHMVYTTLPAYGIALLVYGLIGLRFGGNPTETQRIASMLSTIDAHFIIHPVLLVPPCLVILMVIRKIPPLPALLAGMMLGGLFAICIQGRPLADVVQAAHTGFVSNTQNASVDRLLTRGGLMSMMETVALIFCGLSFGGILEKTGMIDAIARPLLKRVERTGSLVAITLASCISMNMVTANQLIAIILPGRMMKTAFEERGLHPKNLSRCLEDSGTLTSPLIPWNTCGAFMHVTLGVNPFLFLPYAFFNWITPLVSLLYGYTGWTMVKRETQTGPFPGS